MALLHLHLRLALLPESGLFEGPSRSTTTTSMMMKRSTMMSPLKTSTKMREETHRALRNEHSWTMQIIVSMRRGDMLLDGLDP